MLIYNVFYPKYYKQLIELQGTIAFRENKLKKSLAYFKKLPANYWEANYYFSEYLTHNPFSDEIILEHYEYYQGEEKTSKIAILERLIALKNKAETTKDPILYFEFIKVLNHSAIIRLQSTFNFFFTVMNRS